MEKTVGVPTVKAMTGALTDAAVGAGGGLLYLLSRGMLGNGFLGSLVAIILAGSVVKGTRGQTLATVAGFMALAGLGGGGGAAASTGARERM